MTESLAAQSRLLAGRYRIGRVLGRGGMGTVWEAHDEMLDRDVAVKEVVPPPELTAEQRSVLRQRTLREARAAARINHPGAVTVHDVVEEGGHPFIVMQLLPPRTLADVLAANGPLPPAQVARIGLDLVDALAAAHVAGVLHRDVKPANVMLTDAGRAVLTDFGIATVEEDPTLTSTGMLLGSPAYMAPERARGERPSPASDLWSLGATLFTAVQGDPPFRREGNLPTLNAVLTEEAPPATRAGPLAPVIAALLSRDPAARPDAAWTRRLLHYAEDTGAHPVPPPPLPPTAPTVVVDPPVVDPPPVDPPVVDRPVEPTAVTEPVASRPPNVTPPPAKPVVTEPAAAAVSEPAAFRPAEPPARRRGRGTGVALALALVVAALAAVFALARHPSTDSGSASGPARATSTPSTPATSESGSGAAGPTPSTAASTRASTRPSAAASTDSGGATRGTGSTSSGRGAGGVPAGFQAYRDPSGFSLVIPAGWSVSHQGTTLYVKQPGGRAYLQVPQTTQPKPDALADWQQQAAYGASHFNGYKQLRLERVAYKGWDAADWEFLWTASGGPLHVLDRNVRVSDRRAYALYWSVPAQDWAQRQRDFAVIAESFRPPGS